MCVWHLVYRKWRMTNTVIEKEDSCFTSVKKCKFPKNRRWLHFVKLNKTDSEIIHSTGLTYWTTTLLRYSLELLHFYWLVTRISKVLAYAHTEGLMLAGTYIWSRYMCEKHILVLCQFLTWMFLFFILLLIYLLAQGPFFLLIKGAYYRKTTENYTEYKFKYRVEKEKFPWRRWLSKMSLNTL